MYVATFYSFKGGVGRSMALANVAVALAKAGKRVLMVDFDLEAPGLESFFPDSSQPTSPGLVDFVHAYLDGAEAPAADAYLYQIAIPGAEDRLWLMPAGRAGNDYSERLASLDWAHLYEHEDGYLLFEDLKAQWERDLTFDYVLIDSRTGHTDEAGICTRQLPDAVVILFFPNAQNRVGLQHVVRGIREEQSSSRQRAIAMHFVMSNVPDLDDEEHIIDQQMRAFRGALNIRRRPLVIHRYDSLALLNQSLFLLDRPRSRLAREYRRLTSTIRRQNPSDSEGAIAFLEDLEHRPPGDPIEIEGKLAKIGELHAGDPNVLFNLGKTRMSRGQWQEALHLFFEAAKAGYSAGEVHYAAAEAYQAGGNLKAAAEEAVAVLDAPDVGYGAVSGALGIVRTLNPGAIVGIASRAGVRSLPPLERMWFASQLNDSYVALLEALSLLQLASDDEAAELTSALTEDFLPLVLIGLGKFSEAVQLLERKLDQRVGIADSFNLAAARWGLEQKADVARFAAIVTMANRTNTESGMSANYHQCMALSHFVIGDVTGATIALNKSRDTMNRRQAGEFSAWRYLQVTPTEFLRDLDEMESQGRAGVTAIHPKFLGPDRSELVGARARE